MSAPSILLAATIISLVLINCSVKCFASNATNQEIDNQRAHNNILSRKRRYLIFPEGSSLQVVFDEIIPVVDYNNFLIVGVTVALAWELPSKPPSEQLEDIREKLNDGTLGIRKDENVNNIKYVDKQAGSPNLLRLSPQGANLNYVYGNRRKWNHIQPEAYFYQKATEPLRSSYVNAQSHGKWLQSKRIPFWEASGNRNFEKLPSYTDSRKQSKVIYTSNYNRHRHMYPVFGKRSIPDAPYSRDEILHLEYHRKSRHQLYTKIEKYFNSQGKHGEHCVLKLLCETGQRAEETQPGSFLGEIMRAVFSFPEGHDKIRNELFDKYERAHRHTGNCTDQYYNCPHQFDE